MSKVTDPTVSKLERNLRYYRTQIEKTLGSVRAVLSVAITSDACNRLECSEGELNKLRTDYAETVRKILEAVSDDEFDAKCESLSADQNELFDQCRQVIAQSRTAVTQFKGKTARDSLGGNPPHHSTFNESSSGTSNAYPKIRVPHFDGDYRQFMRFKGIYLNIVHEEESIPAVRKLYYLQEALSGEAARLIEDLPMQAESYAEAWKRICTRYDNQRALVMIYFRELTAIQPIKTQSELRGLLDQVTNALNNLKLCGLAAENWGDMVAYMVYQCLDTRTRDDFDNTLTNTTKFFSWKALHSFLTGRALTTETRKLAESAKPKFDDKSPKADKSKSKSDRSSFAVTRDQCLACPECHLLIQCPVFESKTPRQRFQLVARNRLCTNCFSSKHPTKACKRLGCKTCGQLHHTLLHFTDSSSSGTSNARKSIPPSNNAEPNSAAGSSSSTSQVPPATPSTAGTVTSHFVNSYAASVSSRPTIVLPSAIVHIRCGDRVTTARVLLDSCSQVTLISEDFVRKCRLPTVQIEDSQRISGVNPGVLQPQTCCSLSLVSRFKQFALPIVADVVPQTSLRYLLSGVQLPPPESRPKGVRYADPAFLCNAVDVPLVDILLGAEYYEQCLLNQTKPFGSLRLRNTHFGWTVIGPVSSDSSPAFCALVATDSPAPLRHDIESQLRRFCELEDVAAPCEDLGEEKNLCIRHFEETYARGADGKFVVRLPLRSADINLIDNFTAAKRQLTGSERRRPAEIKDQYIEFMKEYERLGHMTLVRCTSESTYFLPHRAVLRPTSSTTKVRVVFNASSVTASGKSLNDQLLVGPKLQPDLVDILLRFRAHVFAFNADIEKMYRCIWVHPEDRHLQCILWRETSDQPVRIFQLNTVTYGTASASFLATKCLAVLAESTQEPKAAFAIANQFYMDDLLTGADTLEECRSLQRTIHDTLAAAGFVLRKYHSNSAELLSSIDPTLVEADSPLHLDGENATSLLGIYWVSESDVFRLRVVKPLDDYPVVSKRRLLSEVSKTFDPLGFAAPFTIRAKIFMQQVWKEGGNWDDPVSDSLATQFSAYWRDISLIKDFSIPRAYCSASEVRTRELIGFSDASEQAFCAVIYMRCTDVSENVSVSFVCAKTRVAPVRAPISVQRLELQAALLLSQLAERVAQTLDFNLAEFIAFSDSQVTLSWLAKPPEVWKSFVRNRVAKIIEVLPFERWSYVSSGENPADLATRGLSASKFTKSQQQWLCGPEFLKTKILPGVTIDDNLELEKRRPKPLLSLQTNLVDFCSTDFSEFSSFSRLIRAYAFVLRFLNNCKATTIAKQRPKAAAVPSLDASEICAAEERVIRVVQRTSFSEVVSRLLQGAKLKKKCALTSLNPFIDEKGLLRVGGRLRNANLPFEKKHPLILSASCHFVVILVRHLHLRFFHAQKSFLLTHLRSKFWFYGNITRVVKKCIHTCVTCVRYDAVSAAQLMGDLPSQRVTISRPFTNVGVDFAGPFTVKCVGHRSTVRFKSYVAFFVCLSTRALHLEVVSELTTDAFLLCLSRFIARRGRPYLIWSDNGTNFVGAARYLDLSDAKISDFSAERTIRWKFNPPRAPHRGGIWESAVKSMKRHLVRSTNEQVFTFEELTTVVCRVEAILNSRPLVSKPDADQGNVVITPGHFLIGDSLLSDPEPPEIKLKLAKRYEIVRRTIATLWRLWSKDYLSQLQSRNKWKVPEPNVLAGAIVILRNDSAAPCDWKLGEIVEVFPDSNNHVRTVDVRVSSGKIKRRAISSIVLLPGCSNAD